MRLKGKVVVVTASTRGIGLAIVKACAAEGAIVYMGARNLERAKEIADQLNAEGKKVRWVYNDATEDESYAAMIEEVVEKEGRIDVLVNNFGTSDPKQDLDFAHTDVDVFLNTVNINLKSVYLASQAAVKHMEKNGGGSIINISSIGGQTPDISQVAYGTSKAAINYLTKLIAVQAVSYTHLNGTAGIRNGRNKRTYSSDRSSRRYDKSSRGNTGRNREDRIRSCNCYGSRRRWSC